MTLRKSGRRSFFRKMAGAAAATSFWSDDTLDAAVQNVNKNSNPSQLRITDLRCATITRAPMTDTIIRIDTNQGIYGLGEVRDGASELMRSCSRAAFWARTRAASIRFSARSNSSAPIPARPAAFAHRDGAWDLAGKVYNVPVYQMLGGKFRDKIRCYADTTESDDPKIYGQRLKARKEQGFTWLKMDLGIDLLKGQEGMVTHAASVSGDGGNSMLGQGGRTVHMLTGIELTPRGVDRMAEFAATAPRIRRLRYPAFIGSLRALRRELLHPPRQGSREIQPRLARGHDPVAVSGSAERDQAMRSISRLLTGEDIYLKENFIKLASMHAVDILHPDLATSGGILETHKIGDAIEEHGVAHGHALRRIASIVYGECALRRGDEQFPCSREPFG